MRGKKTIHCHRVISMWIVFVWLWWFLWLIIWIVTLHFLMTRWRSITSNVRENIARFNQIAAADKTCQRCNDQLLSLPPLPSVPPPPLPIVLDTCAEGAEQTTTASIIEQPPVCDDGAGVAIKTSIELRNSDGKISLHRVISYTGAAAADENSTQNNEDLRILEICRTKNLVSKLTKKFETAKTSSSSLTSNSRAAAFKKSSEDFLRRTSSSAAATSKQIKSPAAPYQGVQLPDATVTATDTDQDYFVIEKTEVYEVTDTKPNQSSPYIITKRSHSFGEIRRNRKTPTETASAASGESTQPPGTPSERVGSMENILEIDDRVQLRRNAADEMERIPDGGTGSVGGRRSVRTVDDILQQERFSKCFSEYSISDLLNDLPDYQDNYADDDDEDIELTNFLNRIK